jgi:starch phosphorylase
LSAKKFAKAKELAAWKRRVLADWGKVAVVSVETDSGTVVTDLGSTRRAVAEVSLGDLEPSDVAVELVHGSVSGGDELVDWQIVRMELTSTSAARGSSTWEGGFACDTAGRHGFTVRVVPSNPDLTVAAEMGCVAWA